MKIVGWLSFYCYVSFVEMFLLFRRSFIEYMNDLTEIFTLNEVKLKRIMLITHIPGKSSNPY